MDTLTHALSGALLARATVPRAGRHHLSTRARVIAGFAAAAFPDVDFVLGYVSPVAYVTGHRGVTHSIVLLPLWALLLAWIFAKLDRWPSTWRDYYGVAALSIGIHIVVDVITSFGTMIYAPWSDARVAWGMTFIIDLWFTGIIVAALALSALWRRSRWPATIGLAVLAGYVAFQGALHQRALELGREFAALNGSNAATVSAYPRPVSPFNWMVVVSEPERYRYAFVNLIRKEVPPTPGADAGFITRLDAAYLPRSLLKWTIRERAGTSADERALIAQAWEQPALAFYRWFSALPVTYRIERGNPSTCVWFEDLRFLTPGRDAMPFRFGACREGDSGAWEAFQLTDAGARVRAR